MSKKVCIIGSGPAGLSAAYFLDQLENIEKAHVTILEKENRVGGKCFTVLDKFHNDTYAYDMGAIEITPYYDLVNSFIEKFKLEISDIPDSYIIDRSTGETEKLEKFLLDDINPIVYIEQLKNFGKARKPLIGYLDTPGFNGVPPSLQRLSTKEWLIANACPDLERLFWMVLTGYGYGYVEEVPAIYTLKYSTIMSIGNTLRRYNLAHLVPKEWELPTSYTKPPVYGLKLGFQNLMENIAKSLHDYPILGADIINIERLSKNKKTKIIIEYIQDGRKFKKDFDYLIVAIPQTLSNLSFFPLNDKEKNLLQYVFTSHYYTTLKIPNSFEFKLYEELKVTTPDNHVISGPPVPCRQPIQFLRNWPEPNNCVFYTYASESPMTELEVKNAVDENIRNFGQEPGITIQTKFWDKSYFPHVSKDKIFSPGGFYDELDEIQGKNGTFWIGGLLNFELVEMSMRYSKYFIE